MAKVALIQVVYNSRKFIPKVFPAALNQTYKDTEFVVVIAGNDDGGKEYIAENFPQVKIIDPGYNIGFARGHNEFFAATDAEFIQLINPDLIITPTFVEEMLKPFEDPKVGAVSGKLLQYDFNKDQPTGLIDTTGVFISKSGGGRDRGQNEVDNGQYDDKSGIMAVSGAGVMYRKAALMDVAYMRPDGRREFLDEEFEMYWEEIDLGWRLQWAGWSAKFTPKAIAYHGRTAGSNPGGYKKVFSFIKHHKKFTEKTRRLNYQNHIFMFIKNSPKWYWKFFVREFFYQCYVLVFETRTLGVLPQMFKRLPIIWKKRKYIKQHRKISVAEMDSLLI